jgi:TRAP-type C4-dicarboxylate transport system permease large subunit
VAGLRKLWPVGIAALVVIVGIYGGILTVDEAGGWGCLVILIIAMSWGKMRLKQLGNILCQTVSMVAMLFLLLIAARVFGRFLVVSGVAQYLLNTLIAIQPNTWQLLLGLMVLYLIMGCFLDSVSMLSITIPIIYPLIEVMGIEPMLFAMIVILSIEAGLITPPVGLNAFGVKSVAEDDVTIGDIFRGVLPFLFMTVLAIVIIIVFPAVANWLPQQMVR